MLLAASATAGVLAEFGQHAEGALGMQEGDLRIVRANKPGYTPHVDCGDYVIVINAEK